MAGGFSPVVHLYSQAQGKLRWDEKRLCFVPDACRQAVRVVGRANGGFPLRHQAAVGGGRAQGVRRLPERRDYARRTPRCAGRLLLGRAFQALHHDRHVDRPGEDLEHQRARDPRRRDRAQHRRPPAPRPSARPTRRSAYGDPGRARPRRLPRADSRHADARLARRARRRVRERRPVEAPWYYGREMHDAVQMEARNVRKSLGVLDASTLGKIDIQGATRPSSSTASTPAPSARLPSAVRATVSCAARTAWCSTTASLRASASSASITTTTGGAARVLDWLEE